MDYFSVKALLIFISIESIQKAQTNTVQKDFILVNPTIMNMYLHS